MISDLLSSQTIRLQIPVKNWREAVLTSGNLLVKAGKCTQNYVDAMCQVIQEKGAYMVIAPGLALTHARPEDGALDLGMSIVSLSTPVNFGSEANDPVKLIIAFCSVDRTSHLKTLKTLACFLMDEENQILLKSSHSVDEILTTFQQTDMETIKCQQ